MIRSGVNRPGKAPAYAYDGSAYVFSPFGEDVLKGGPCALDPEELERCRAEKMNARRSIIRLRRV